VKDVEEKEDLSERMDYIFVDSVFVKKLRKWVLENIHRRQKYVK
jgi:hypothetical protein